MKLKNKLTNNLGLKLLALVISFALWLVVVNVDDPVIDCTFTGIQVEILNGDSLTTRGKVYEVLNNTDNISVTITGKRSVIESIAKENIRATADLSDLTLMDTAEIKVTTNKNYNLLDAVKSETAAVEFSIEDLQEIHLPIEVVVEGSPDDGYVVGDIQSNQNTIRVSGPASLVSQIDTARCMISVDGRTTDITTTSDIILTDSEGMEIDQSHLSTNIRMINVSAAILPIKAVDILYSYSGLPEEGYVVYGDLTGDHMAVYIAGRQNVLDSISSIEVPATAINVDGMNEPYTEVVDLSKYLPDGVRFADSEFDGMVAVNVDIEKTVSKTFNVPMENLSIINVPTGMNAEMFLNNDLTLQNGDKVVMRVSVSGVDKSLEDIKADEITGYIDVSEYLDQVGMNGLQAGVYQMDITFELPENTETTQEYNADVRLSLAE